MRLTMRLDQGLPVSDLREAEHLAGTTLALDLDAKEDGELGGVYFAFLPRLPPELGVVDVRVRRNFVEGMGWSLPHRKDLSFFAEIGLVGPDLLEVGRVAAAFAAATGQVGSVAGYTVTAATPGPEGRALWRAHRVDFPDAEAAAPRWRPLQRPGSREESAVAGPSPDLIRRGDGHRAPDLFCHLTFGFTTGDREEASEMVSSFFSTPLAPRTEESMGGAYLGWSSATAAGALSEIVVRPNAQSPWTWLYPDRKEHPLLLDLALLTPNLLELGRISAAIEERFGDALAPVAYRVVGDLVRDHVPRMLEREFRSREEGTSTFLVGHERLRARDDQEDEDDPEEELPYPAGDSSQPE